MFLSTARGQCDPEVEVGDCSGGVRGDEGTLCMVHGAKPKRLSSPAN